MAVPNQQEPPPGQLDQRVQIVEQDVAIIKRDVAVILSNYVTKGDMHKALNEQTWRLVTFVCGFGAALVAATYFIAKHSG